MKISDLDRQWLEWVLISSIPLRRLNLQDEPIDIASGTLIDYRGHRFLLSVKHAVDRDSDRWVIDLGYTSGRGTEVFRLNSFNYVAEMVRGSSVIRDIDFCYTEVPRDLVSTYQDQTPMGVSDERPRHIFQTDLSDVPNLDGIYAFSGQVKPERHGSLALGKEIAFPNKIGARYSAHTLNEAWKRACEHAQVSYVSLYPSTRHTTATSYAARGASEEQIEGMLGHSTRGMSKKYVKRSVEMLRHLVDGTQVVSLTEFHKAK